MLTIRRFALLALLTGLVAGCQSKTKSAGGSSTPEEHMAKKIKMANDAPQGPKLRE